MQYLWEAIHHALTLSWLWADGAFSLRLSASQRSQIFATCDGAAWLTQVPRTVLQRVSSDQEQEKLSSFELRSYVEDNKRLTWCPAPGCENAVECVRDLAPGEPLDVACKCGAAFCFSCKEEAHRPVSSVVLYRLVLHHNERLPFRAFQGHCCMMHCAGHTP